MRKVWGGMPSHLDLGTPKWKEVAEHVNDNFYFIDMEVVPEGLDLPGSWKMWEVSQHETNINISMGLRWCNVREMASATLEMGINNKDTWPAFLGKPGSKWTVTIRPAG